MKDAYIPDKGLLVVDKSLKAKDGDIIVAVVNGEFTIKRLQESSAGIFLMPANQKYKPLKITEEMDFRVWGVVTNIIIDTKAV